MRTLLTITIKSQALEAAIARSNLSHKELACELGISSSYLSQVICGRKSPSAAMRRRLLKYFRDYTFDDLFAMEEGGNGR